jgi:hypothetical protein
MIPLVRTFLFAIATVPTVAVAEVRSIKCNSEARQLSVDIEGESVRVQVSMNSDAESAPERKLVYSSPAGMNAPQGSNIQFFVVDESYAQSGAQSQLFISVDWAAVTASMAFVNMVGVLFVDDKFVCRRLD